jgi:hypothetical protein
MRLFIFKPDTDQPHCCAAIAESEQKAIDLILTENRSLERERIEFLVDFELSDHYSVESFVSLTEEWP